MGMDRLGEECDQGHENKTHHFPQIERPKRSITPYPCSALLYLVLVVSLFANPFFIWAKSRVGPPFFGPRFDACPF